jgi:diguanylate cyclase (GGDEF)-like protein
LSTTLVARDRKSGRRQPVPSSVRAFIGALALLAIATAAFTILTTQALHVQHGVAWPIIALALVGAEFIPVRFHTEGQSIQVDLMAVPMAVGAVFTTPRDLILAVLAASVVSSLLRRETPERSVFNVVSHVSGAAVARLVIAVVLGTASPAHVRGLVALCLAVLAFEMVTTLAVLIVVTLASGAQGKDYFRSVWLHLGLVTPLNAVLAMITVTVALAEIWGMLLLAGPCLVLALWYRAANLVRNRYANLQLLYGFTVKLAGLSDTDEIISAALGEARTLLNCELVGLYMPLGASGLRCEVEADKPLRREFSDLTGFERSIVESGTPILLPHGKQHRVPLGRDLKDVMAVPVHLGDIGSAVLMAANHAVDTETFDEEDLRLFEAVAANVSTALTSSRRLDRLRLEVSAREHQALHDGLTGLANRTLFAQWVSSALEQRGHDQIVGVMLMDLDGFKDINDTLGHHTGDAILKEISGRALAAVGSARLAARLGGDEFAFVVPMANNVQDVLDVAESVLESVSRPIAIDGVVLELRASIGVATAPQHGSDASMLLQRSDVAMYSAKAAKRGIVLYDREIDQHTKRRLTLATELRRAMEEKELEVWYQPVVSLETGDVSGLEALLRWRHREYGSISPDEFIPVAEQTGLIEPLTWWVLETALRELNRWRHDGYELTMAVNVSARSLLGPEIVDRLARMLTDIKVPPKALALEITESLMMVDPEWSERILTELADLGTTIAIDDFGTGYSSLSRLKRLPVHTVKIDRSFVSSMHEDEGDAAIVRATIDLARNLGHTVIAEGVELQETADALRSLGCTEVQGYLYAAAMPVDECRNWVQNRQSPAMAPVRALPRIARGA